MGRTFGADFPGIPWPDANAREGRDALSGFLTSFSGMTNIDN
jgi:hypothetical protein